MSGPPAPAPRAPGTRIAPGYRLLAHLHRSRDLDVHDAWSERRATRCVVKVLRPDRAGDARAARALRAEARLLLGLSHPHIVRAYPAAGAREPIVVTETLPGSTLAHLLETVPAPLTAADIAHLGLHLASALAYLHRGGLLHLDLKPGNVVAHAGRATLIDLSIARPPGPGRRGLGTRLFMAPEQVTGAPFTAATDVWGLGVVLFTAATRRPAFTASEDPDAPAPQLVDRPPRVADLRPDLPAALHALIDRCLCPDPAGRPALDEVLVVLEEATGVPPDARLHLRAIGPQPPSTRR